MNNVVAILVYAAVLIILYGVLFSQKGEATRMKTGLKNQDWIVFFSIIFGGVVLAQTVMDTGIQLPSDYMLFGLSAFFLILLIVAIVRKRKSGRPMVQMMGDERMSLIGGKSARNALFTTYLVLFVHSCLNETVGLNTTWLLIMLGAGVAVMVASMYIYYYRKG